MNPTNIKNGVVATIAILFGGEATVQLAAQNYLVAIGLAVVTLAAALLYEYLP